MVNKLRILGVQRKARRMTVITALVGLGLVLSACGQKGPLYLPKQVAQQTAESAVANGSAPSSAKKAP